MTTENLFMQRALELAQLAQSKGEVPVGAVVVYEGNIIGEGYNQPISAIDTTAHAEIMAIRQACQARGNYRLVDCDMFVSLEPCAMCAGAIVHARIKNLHFAASDPKTGACGTVVDLVSQNPTGHRVKVLSGLFAEQAQNMLQLFFKARREQKKREKSL